MIGVTLKADVFSMCTPPVAGGGRRHRRADDLSAPDCDDVSAPRRHSLITAIIIVDSGAAQRTSHAPRQKTRERLLKPCTMYSPITQCSITVACCFQLGLGVSLLLAAVQPSFISKPAINCSCRAMQSQTAGDRKQ